MDLRTTRSAGQEPLPPGKALCTVGSADLEPLALGRALRTAKSVDLEPLPSGRALRVTRTPPGSTSRWRKHSMLEKREREGEKACATRGRETGSVGWEKKSRVSLLYTVNSLRAEMGRPDQ